LTNPPSSSTLDNSSNQMPPAQQRQMVMPDRMRWIYRDPQGFTQGPWSGLEMHDWYKAGFFSPELLVRKYEDKEYEPLAQLIRRIGNSREPFLVPQIGIPHGPPVNPPGGTTIGTAASSSGMQSGAVQPPFASNFPSFGTTLTADQQNALERRKQEEQFLMARQKEHLAHQQVLMRQFQGQGMPPHGMHPQGLHHHSSAHSLQSQPSYGSIASPAGYQGSPAPMPLQQQPAGMPNYFDRPGLTQANYGNDTVSGREPDFVASLDRLGLGRGRQSAYGSPMGQIPPSGVDHQQQVATMLQDRARLQMEQEQAGISGHMTEQESIDRLEQYHQFRGEYESDELGNQIESDPDLAQDTIPGPDYRSLDITEQTSAPDTSASVSEAAPAPLETSQAPAPSISPLPAPSAQRSRPHAAEKLNIESGSRSDTPSAETPTTATIAPWAKDNVEGPKGPSLKEIQEAEARKAAQQEEIAAAARRALAEQERAAAAQAQAQNVAGLPSGANWAASSSPTTNAPSAWTKKPAASTPPAGAKKTLSQIQKEEELRKNRAAASATASISATPTAGPGGKRYADLAGKSAVPSSSASGGAWTTVGAGGKPKAPAGSATSAPPQRTVSTGGPAPTTPTSSKVTAPVRANSSVSAKQTATDELQRWAKAALGKGLNSGIDGGSLLR
jgi:PERQ amino acid-rich with GYF domain-containing protein